MGYPGRSYKRIQKITLSNEKVDTLAIVVDLLLEFGLHATYLLTCRGRASHSTSRRLLFIWKYTNHSVFITFSFRVLLCSFFSSSNRTMLQKIRKKTLGDGLWKKKKRTTTYEAWKKHWKMYCTTQSEHLLRGQAVRPIIVPTGWAGQLMQTNRVCAERRWCHIFRLVSHKVFHYNGKKLTWLFNNATWSMLLVRRRSRSARSSFALIFMSSFSLRCCAISACTW